MSPEWPPRHLLNYISGYRGLIALDRARYGKFRAYLDQHDVELSKLAGEALKARARYYRGEIVRAKLDTKRFALGEDPVKPSRYGEMACEWVTTYLYELPKLIELDDPALIESSKTSIREITNTLERITYGG